MGRRHLTFNAALVIDGVLQVDCEFKPDLGQDGKHLTRTPIDGVLSIVSSSQILARMANI
jgi:hypothetical protein